MTSKARVAAAAVSLLTVLAAGLPASAQEVVLPATDGRGDPVVVAVIDSGFSPYHWDFLASQMPQALDVDPSNDLPLDQAPDTWLPGFSASNLAAYEPLELSLEEDDESTSLTSLDSADSETWSTVQTSTANSVKYYWMPGTKVVGAVDFAGTNIHAPSDSHGMGTSTVSVGNLHGTCPECLLVFITYSTAANGEAAMTWASNQPWIDVITNSYGFSAARRDRYYNGETFGQTRAASERGQTILFSSGNGQYGAFDAPNTTLLSSQEGPDWIITVGAVSPNGDDYSGAGKPADIASVGNAYPSGYEATNVTNGGGFGGTSNATPVTAGIYSHTLYMARRALAGDSKTQVDGVIATGTPIACGAVRPECELGDGILTASELRTRLFEGAAHTDRGLWAGYFVNGDNNPAPLPTVPDEEKFLHEGHGTYFGLLKGTYSDEIARIFDPMVGAAAAPTRPAGENEWMRVDSWCRQQIWGAWGGGYYKAGATLPAASPTFPLRSVYENTCPVLVEARP